MFPGPKRSKLGVCWVPSVNLWGRELAQTFQIPNATPVSDSSSNVGHDSQVFPQLAWNLQRPGGDFSNNAVFWVPFSAGE